MDLMTNEYTYKNVIELYINGELKYMGNIHQHNLPEIIENSCRNSDMKNYLIEYSNFNKDNKITLGECVVKRLLNDYNNDKEHFIETFNNNDVGIKLKFAYI